VANQAEFSVSLMCRVLGVSRSGYYAWRTRRPSARSQADDDLQKRIRTIHEGSHGTYGRPRIHACLRSEGRRVSGKRVARLMRLSDIVGVSRRTSPRRIKGQKECPPAPDLVKRQFVASEPNRLWVADITYVPTSTSFLYLAVVLDVWSRRVVGWAMASHLRSSLVLDALTMAFAQRRPNDVIHHSDQGSQYTSLAFGQRCREMGVRPSMGTVGDCFDNALCESFFATLECELFERSRFRTHEEAKLAIFCFIEGWYNPHRLHSALGYMSPVIYERRQFARLEQAA
jgi:putative transposase